MNMYPQNEAGYLLHRRIQAAAKAKKAKKAVRREKIRKAGTAPTPPKPLFHPKRFFLVLVLTYMPSHPSQSKPSRKAVASFARICSATVITSTGTRLPLRTTSP